MLHFSKSVSIWQNSSLSWQAWGWVHFTKFSFLSELFLQVRVFFFTQLFFIIFLRLWIKVSSSGSHYIQKIKESMSNKRTNYFCKISRCNKLNIFEFLLFILADLHQYTIVLSSFLRDVLPHRAFTPSTATASLKVPSPSVAPPACSLSSRSTAPTTSLLLFMRFTPCSI